MRFAVTVLGYQLVGLALALVELGLLAFADPLAAQSLSKPTGSVLVATGSVVGVLIAFVHGLASALRRPPVVIYCAVAAGPLYALGVQLFSGAWISRQSYAPLGPAILMLAGCAALSITVLVSERLHQLRRGVAELLWVALGLGLLAANSAVLPHLYPRFHDALLLTSFICLGEAVSAAVAQLLHRLRLRGRWLMAPSALALLAIGSVPVAVVRSPNLTHRELWAYHAGNAAQVYSRTKQDYRWCVLQWKRLRHIKDSAYAESVAAWLDENRLTQTHEPEQTHAAWQSEQDLRAATRAPVRRGARKAQPLNIVLITVDALRADEEARSRGDNGLAAFADPGLRFRRAYVPGTSTAISLEAVLTGRVGGGDDNIIKRLRARDYEAVFITSREAYGWLRYSDQDWLDDLERIVKVPGAAHASSAAITEAGKRVVDESSGARPLFLWVHYFGVHEWNAKNPAAEGTPEAMTERYRAAWARESEQVVSLLTHLQRKLPNERTVYIFTSDHGELLGEQGRTKHGRWVEHELVRVPLWLRAPGYRGADIDRPVGLIDLAPTIAELVGLPLDGYDGYSLLRPAPKRRLLLMGAQREISSMRGSHRLVLAPVAGTLRLFDETDPDVSREIASPPEEIVRDLLEPLLGSPYARRDTSPLDEL